MKRSILIRGGTFLLAAFVLSFVVLLLIRHQYARMLAAKVWPTSRFEASLGGQQLQAPRTILLLGDSRVADWGVPKIKGWQVVNAGLPGVTSGELVSCCGSILTQTRPEVVVIQVGINDLKLVGVRQDLSDEISECCVTNILTIVTECRQVGAYVIVTPVWPAGKVTLARWLVWSAAVNPTIAKTNTRLLDRLADQKDVYIADFFPALEQNPSTKRPDQFYRDTLHLTPEAYARFSVLLEKKMQNRVQNVPAIPPW